jgi:hypothetical protein
LSCLEHLQSFKMSRLGHLQSFNMSRLGHLQSFNMSHLGHLQLFRTFAIVSESSKQLENNYRLVHVKVDTKYGLCNRF